MKKYVVYISIMSLVSALFLTAQVKPLRAEEAVVEEELVEEYYEEEILGKERRAIMELSANSSRGNSETGSIHFGADILYKPSKNWIHFAGETYYSEAEDNIDARVIDGRITGGHEMSSDVYIFTLASMKSDLRQHLDSQTTIGVGMGYNLLNVSYERLAVELGFGMNSENYDEWEDKNYTMARLGLDYVLKISETARFENKSEYITSLENKKDYRIRSEFKLLDQIYKNIGILVKVVVDYNGYPVDSSLKRMDVRTLAGMTFDFM